MFRLVSAIVALLLCSSAMALAQNQPPSPSPREPEITTWGRGEVKLAPNYAYVLFGVATQSPSAVETASENARKIAAVLSALRALGLTLAEIQELAGTYLQRTDEPIGPRLAGALCAVRARTEQRIGQLRTLLQRIAEFEAEHVAELTGEVDFRTQDPRYRA